MGRGGLLMDLRFDATATVYTADPTTGAWTVVAQSNLPCRLLLLPRQPGETNQDRAERAALRRFRFDPSYALPASCQIEVDGVRWNPIAINGYEAVKNPNGTVAWFRCDVLKAT